jgi:3-deoxy-D-manno-octulosonic-acid transferase
MVLLNGRLSARSYTRWRWFPGLIRPVLGAFTLCLAQDHEQAGRLRSLGARSVAMAGDLKAAADALPTDAWQLESLGRQIGRRPVWLAASTHPGEEEIIAEVHRELSMIYSNLLTMIVPRHPTRGEAIAGMLSDRGLRAARRCRGEPITGRTDIYIADTMGELGLFYALAGVAFVGGSLVAKGGHNPFEAVRLDCVVLHGPHVSNCAGMAAELDAAGAAETVSNANELMRAVSRLLADPDLIAERVAAGRLVAAVGLGVLDAVLMRLAPWLDPLAPVENRLEPAQFVRA